MANPSGKNSPVHFEGFVQNPPVYGAQQRNADLARSAPSAGQGAAASALNSPQRNQRRAAKGTAPAPLPQAPAAIVVPPQVPYQQVAAATWAQVAANPGASDLVKQLAQEAQLGSTG